MTLDHRDNKEMAADDVSSVQTVTDTNSLDIEQIQRLLPHRFPFLLIDRVTDYQPGKYLYGIKNVSINEPFFPGHFPQAPVMPGVLVIEALAQATGLLAMKTAFEDVASQPLYYLVGVDKARFKRPVMPGDQLRLSAELIKCRREIWLFNAVATVDGAVAASAEIMCTARV